MVKPEMKWGDRQGDWGEGDKEMRDARDKPETRCRGRWRFGRPTETEELDGAEDRPGDGRKKRETERQNEREKE